MLLAQPFSAVIKRGELTVIDGNGRTRCYGDPGSDPRVTIRLHDRRLHWRLPLNPRLAVGEAYMNGTLTVEGGTIYDFLDLVGRNLGNGRINAWDKWLMSFETLWRGVQQANPLPYGDQQRRGHNDALEIAPTELHSVDDALERLGHILGRLPDWQTLMTFLPDSLVGGIVYRSAISSTFAAGLELAKSGQLEIRQSGTFGPIYFRSRSKTG